MSEKILIVFTDEVGSSSKMEHMTSSAQVKTSVINHFAHLLSNVVDNRTKVVKNIGDSLFLRFDGESSTNFKSDLIKVLTKFVSAFNAFDTQEGQRIRIVAHLVNAGDVFKFVPPQADGENRINEFGSELKKQLVAASEDRNLADIWPGFESMRLDIFGHGINLAARYAGIPGDPTFVISNRVFEEIKDKFIKLDDGSFWLERTGDLISIPDGEILRISRGVPLIRLKGLKSPNADEPHFLHQVTFSKVEDQKTKDFYSDLKRKRVIYVVDFWLKGIRVSSSVQDVVSKFSQEKLLIGEEVDREFLPPAVFYQDMTFLVLGEFFVTKSSYGWLRSDPGASVFPSFLLFCSFPNAQMEEEYRASLDLRDHDYATITRTYEIWEENVLCRDIWKQGYPSKPAKEIAELFGRQSMNIRDHKAYENCLEGRRQYTNKERDKVLNENPVHVDQGRSYLLLMFRVVDSEARYARSTRDFFPQDELSDLNIGDCSTSLVSYGLLRGEKDGYLMYRIDHMEMSYAAFLASMQGLISKKEPRSFFEKLELSSIYFLYLTGLDEIHKYILSGLTRREGD
jgi:hypothetical protein